MCCLVTLDFTKPMVVQTDASETGVGTVFSLNYKEVRNNQSCLLFKYVSQFCGLQKPLSITCVDATSFWSRIIHHMFVCCRIRTVTPGSPAGSYQYIRLPTSVYLLVTFPWECHALSRRKALGSCTALLVGADREDVQQSTERGEGNSNCRTISCRPLAPPPSLVQTSSFDEASLSTATFHFTALLVYVCDQ